MGWKEKYKVKTEIFVWLASFAAFLLIFRLGNIEKSIIKPFDFLMFVSGILIFFSPPAKEAINRILGEISSYSKYLFAILLLIILGQTISYFNHIGANLNFNLVLNYAREIFNSLIFILAAVLIYSNKKIITYISWAVVASPVLILPSLLGFGKNIYFAGWRMIGFFKDPNIFGGWMAAIFLIGLGVFSIVKKRWQKLIIVAWLCVIANFIIWSGSRASWVAVASGLVVWVVFYLIQKRDFRRIISLVAIPIFAFIIGFAILPNEFKPFIIERTIGAEAIKTLNLEEKVKNYNPAHVLNGGGFFEGQIRSDIWKNISIKVLKNPLGFGFNYLDNDKFVINEETISFTTNIFLELAVAGGVGASILLLSLILKIGYSIGRVLKNLGDLELAWITACFALLVSSSFIDGFLFRNLWFAMGVVLGIYWLFQFE